ncbi:MAG: UPF0182 family protein [Sarcina sp.]
MKKKFEVKNLLKVILALVILAIVLIFISTNVIIDIQWFSELNYLNVYFTKIKAIAILVVPIFIVSFLIILIYFKSLKKTILDFVGTEYLKLYKIITIILNLVISLGVSFLVAAGNWLEILKFFNSKTFNQADTIFNMDISFYMFRLPILKSMYKSLFLLLFIVIAITFILYFSMSLKNPVRGNNIVIDLKSRGEGLKNFAGIQLAVASGAILVLLAIGYIFNAYDLVYSPRGVAYGASYTDVKVTLLFYRVISITAVIAAIVVVISILRKKYKPIVFSVGSIVLLIGLQPIVSSSMQQFIVKSNEMEYELPYLKYNMEATQKAYNVDNIEVKSFEPTKEIKSEKLNANKDIVDNLKVNSAEPVLNFYKQVQLIKNYYTFKDVDTDRYNINGEYSQVFIAPREINTSDMPVWQNKHLRYTHGYGVTMSKVNEVTEEGQPSFVMKDIPTENDTDIPLDNPRIYFGENTNDYAIVNTTVAEFDYPTGENENNFSYEGKAGINMSFFNRMLFSIYEQNPKILISSAIDGNSKILINRNIMDRVKKIAPFLNYDEDPYPVINEGRLIWVIDAYTTSDKYPFSEPYEGVNYIRNSVKVTVDAYNGDVNFYIVDENDPVIQNYNAIFKGLFKPASELPEGLAEHFRYPQEIFRLQSKVLAKYHTEDPVKLFTQEDLWDVSSDVLAPQKENTEEGKIEIPVEVLYLMTRLPGQENLEMMLFEYFNMSGKQNMVSLLGARMDKDNYGDLIMYKFPQQRAIYSPYLFKNRILQDPNISKEISLWEGKGSEVVYGDIIIVPIEDSLLYLNTIYLKAATEHSMPEMKRVVMSNGDKIVIESNVEKALEKLFNYTDSKPTTGTEEGTESEETGSGESGNVDIKKAADLFNKAIEAQKSGDWAAYGEYIDELGKLLNK